MQTTEYLKGWVLMGAGQSRAWQGPLGLGREATSVRLRQSRASKLNPTHLAQLLTSASTQESYTAISDLLYSYSPSLKIHRDRILARLASQAFSRSPAATLSVRLASYSRASFHLAEIHLHIETMRPHR